MGTPNVTRVQQLIQEMLNSLGQFSESAQRLGVTGRAQLSAAVPRSILHAPAADTKSSEDNDGREPSKTRSSQDWSENVAEPSNQLVTKAAAEVAEVTGIYDIAQLELVYEEFLMHRERVATSTQWIEEFQQQLDRISGGAEYFTLNGREVITYKRNGNLNVKRLESEHPDKVAHYTRLVTKLQFDKESFEADEPELFKEYRAKVFRVSPKARTARTA